MVVPHRLVMFRPGGASGNLEPEAFAHEPEPHRRIGFLNLQDSP